MQSELSMSFDFGPFPVYDDLDWNRNIWSRNTKFSVDHVEAQNTEKSRDDGMVYLNGNPLRPLRPEGNLFQTHNGDRNWTSTEFGLCDGLRRAGIEMHDRTWVQSNRSVTIHSLVAYTDRPEYSLIPIYAPRQAYAYPQRQAAFGNARRDGRTDVDIVIDPSSNFPFVNWSYTTVMTGQA